MLSLTSEIVVIKKVQKRNFASACEKPENVGKFHFERFPNKNQISDALQQERQLH